VTSRSAETAQISLYMAALTSAHHALAPRSPQLGHRTAPAAPSGALSVTGETPASFLAPVTLEREHLHLSLISSVERQLHEIC
jgi:hypothetical protein